MSRYQQAQRIARRLQRQRAKAEQEIIALYGLSAGQRYSKPGTTLPLVIESISVTPNMLSKSGPLVTLRYETDEFDIRNVRFFNELKREGFERL